MRMQKDKKSKNMSIKVGVVSLGCDKNRVDTEVMLSNLQSGGYEITADPKCADVIIVNTCAFLESSRRESIDTILEMYRHKDAGTCKKIIVTGCLGQKFGKELFESLDEADAIVGTNEYDNICGIVAETLDGNRKLYNGSNVCLTFGNRVLTTSSHFAYLKIGDGCNNFCSYCLIPFIRGRFRSVPMEQLHAQAQNLVAQGVKELILVAQDTTKYGEDLYGEPKLVELLQKLGEIEGLKWLRLLYCYPELTDERLISEIEANPKIVKYIDIPLQHVNDGILKAMNRKSCRTQIEKLFDRLSASEPKISVRSTFICGFPSETQQTIDEMKEFLQKYRLRNVGFFAYSREDGTAAAKFPNQVPQRTKNAYVKQLYKIQYDVVVQLQQREVGNVYECVVDEFFEENDDKFVFRGRTQFMAPDIDGVVYINSPCELKIGEFVDVRITGFSDYDLIGEVVQ